MVLLIKKIVSHKFFNNLIFSIILLSAIIIGLETYTGIVEKYGRILILIDKATIVFFSFEILLKILAHGNKPWKYFRDPWNVFDFIIVAICLVPVSDTHYFAVFRILRVLRIFRMITVLPKLKLIINALLKSIPSMGYVLMLIGILFYVYAVIGVFIFGKSDPSHFGDLHHAFVTLFKVLTLEGWTDIMNIHILGSNDSGNDQIVSLWPFIYFASFIIVGAMIIMNLFIGVIINSMEESQKEITDEINEIKYQDKNMEEIYSEILRKIDDLRKDIKSISKDNN